MVAGDFWALDRGSIIGLLGLALAHGTPWRSMALNEFAQADGSLSAECDGAQFENQDTPPMGPCRLISVAAFHHGKLTNQ